MVIAERDSGIDVIGEVPWGTHFCFFFETREDLAYLLVPYFEAGLKNNEFCICVTSEPLDDTEFKKVMGDAVPGFDGYLDKGQIEFIPYDEWYYDNGTFNLKKAFNGWFKKLQAALARGYDGIRITGSLSWLKRENWKEFIDYENEVNNTLGNSKMLAICTYPLDNCDANGIVGAVSAHQFALVKQNGEFKLIENSELKETKKALRESEARYRSLFDNMLNGFAHCRMLFDDHDKPIDFVYLNVNSAFGKLTGVENVVGRKAMEAIPGIKETHPELFEIYGRVALTGRPETFEIEFKPLAAWLSISVYSTERGYFTAIFEDITERKLAEKELKAAKDQLASELDAMDRLHAISVQYVLNRNLSAVLDEIINAATSITRADMGNIQILDPESGRLKIVAHRGFERPFLDYFDSVAEGHAACGTAMMRIERVVVEDVARSPVFVGTPDLEVMLAAGARAVQSTPLLSRTGRLLGMFSTHYRTSRRPDERELKLIDLLARQTADIIERTLAEKQLVDSKAQAELYLDLMGHDINNLHQIALGYLELARDMPADGEQAMYLDKPVEVLQRSAKLISNVRKLQKLRDGVFQDQDVDVCKVLSDVQQEFGAVPNKTVMLNLNGCERCHVRANELLHDVFANLLGNAVKHTGDRADIMVDLDIVEDDGGRYCQVMVEDDGPGIPDHFKAKIFNRALKGTDKAKGMGLGLYLVKSLVDSYGGRVWVEDHVPGYHTNGARFVVMLPVVEK